MKIIAIESSPHKNGSSNLLAEYFINGAEEAGHQVEIFDVASLTIHPCLGCEACRIAGSCCQKDDMKGLKEKIMESDMLVFITPLYYFGMSAQLKKTLDRFYSFNEELKAKAMKTVLIATAWDDQDWTMRAMRVHYETLCRYLNFDNQGMILGLGCGTVSATKNTEYPKQAYALGKQLIN